MDKLKFWFKGREVFVEVEPLDVVPVARCRFNIFLTAADHFLLQEALKIYGSHSLTTVDKNGSRFFKCAILTWNSIVFNGVGPEFKYSVKSIS